MKKVLAALVLLTMVLVGFAMAESGEEVAWFELTDNVLTVRVPMTEGETWEYKISDPAMLELLTQEEADGMYVASFTNFAPEADDVTLALISRNEAGTMNQVRRVKLEMDEAGVFTVVDELAGNVEEDMGLFYNPMGYELMQVTHVYMPDDTVLCVEGTFGTFEEAEEGGLVGLGFDELCTISLAENCQNLLPASLDEPTVNTEIEDIMAWYEDCSQLLGFEYSFHAAVEMDENGQVTRLEYVYIP